MMFLLSILVIWVHSYNVELFAGKAPGVSFDQAARIGNLFIGDGWPDCRSRFFPAVLLSVFPGICLGSAGGEMEAAVFSALLFLRGVESFVLSGLCDRDEASGGARGVGKEPVPFSAGEMVRAVLDYAYAPVFWYLYQLILLIFLSPAIYLLMKRRILGLAVLAAMLAAIYFHLDTGRPNMDALFYYSFAAYMALHFRDAAESGPGTLGRSRGAGFGLGAAGGLLAAYCLFRALTPGADVLWTVCGRLLAPVSLWILLGAVSLPESRPWMRAKLIFVRGAFCHCPFCE